MSYRGPYERYLAKRGIKIEPARRSFLGRSWVSILLFSLLFAALGLAESLLVGYLPWSRIGHPGVWKIPAWMFLVGLLAMFCLTAEEENWFEKQRKLAQVAVGLGVGLGITLLFVQSPTAMMIGALLGSIAGYFGEHWAKAI